MEVGTEEKEKDSLKVGAAGTSNRTQRHRIRRVTRENVLKYSPSSRSLRILEIETDVPEGEQGGITKDTKC